jgi:polar amino acid transport system substrate-binding protein
MRFTRCHHHRTQVAVRLLLTGLVALPAVFALAACGMNAPQDGKGAAPSSFDKQLHDRLPADIRRAGVVRIGTDASYAPASFFAPDGRTIVGFEPDLAAALERTLGIRIKMINIDFTDALPLVETGQVDAVMSAMTDTIERRAHADFIDYFSAGTAILVQRGNPHGISDLSGLCGAVVAVEEGTTQVDMLKRAQPACGRRTIDIQTYPTNSDALLQLRTGRAVAVLNDYPPAVYTTTDGKTRNHFQLASTTQYEPGPYGIAIAKDRPQLRDVLFDAMAKMIRSGSYAEILHRWSVSDGALPSITINGGTTAPPKALPNS